MKRFILHDSSLALRLDPYRYISRECSRRPSDAFETRLLLDRTLCITGVEAARHFYQEDLFTREGAAPRFLRRTLFGEGGVQGLDGTRHVRRKALFLELVGPGHEPRIVDHLRDRLSDFAAAPPSGRFMLQIAFERILTEAVCDWAGIPLDDDHVAERAEMLAALFDQAVSTLPGHLRSRRARRTADAWATRLIRNVRAGILNVPSFAPLAQVAGWTEADGTELTDAVAGVELLNILRPIVASSAYLTFAAHALHSFPACGSRIQSGDERFLAAFVQEVRRFYPFFPMVVARARTETHFEEHTTPAGHLVALDLYGTDHDARTWEEPDEFRPERFLNLPPCPFRPIPQGGGDHQTGHRCPGEWFVCAMIAETARWLACDVQWEVPGDTDTTPDMAALPALPKDRMTIAEFRAV